MIYQKQPIQPILQFLDTIVTTNWFDILENIHLNRLSNLSSMNFLLQMIH